MAHSTDTRRLAAHVIAANAARVGYDYPTREAECAWTSSHLPRSQKEFRAVCALVREEWGGALTIEIAALLLGSMTMTNSVGDLVLCQHRHDADLPRVWMPARTGRRAAGRHSCSICGEPTSLRANFGFSCQAHYDELS